MEDDPAMLSGCSVLVTSHLSIRIFWFGNLLGGDALGAGYLYRYAHSWILGTSDFRLRMITYLESRKLL